MTRIIFIVLIVIAYCTPLMGQIRDMADTLKLVPTQFMIAQSGTSQFVMKASVLRYNGKVIDIAPVERNDEGDDEYSVTHVISTTSILPQDALELVSSHEWKAQPKNLIKHYYMSESIFFSKARGAHRRYAMPDDKEPAFLKRTFEFIPLKAD